MSERLKASFQQAMEQQKLVLENDVIPAVSKNRYTDAAKSPRDDTNYRVFKAVVGA